MRTRLLLSGCILLWAAATPPLLYAQQPRESRPKIGLVLSGGGARGAAHIGVLKVMEELRVPIDYIAGTSMGAIVGGLYAAGMSPERIEKELLAIDWNDAFLDSPPRREREYRRKYDDGAFLVKFQLGFRDGKFLLPKGLSSGQKLGLILNRLTLPVSSINDFDELLVPYRAAATDIENGEVVVLKSGELYEAMRASMSVPGAFTPYEIGGRLLVDGGLVNNLPIDVVKEMGAETVIAVEISSPYADPDELRSILEISDQVFRIMTRGNTDRGLTELGPSDIVIAPDLGDMSAADFAATGQAIGIGEEGARQAADALRRLSVSEREFQGFLTSQRRSEWDPPVVHRIAIENESYVSNGIVERRINQSTGAPLDPGAIEEDISRVFGLGEFEQVTYHVEEDSQENLLRLRLKGKSWGPNYIRFGLTLADDSDGNSVYNLLVSHSRTQINRFGAEWKNEFQVGSQKRIATEFYQPLDYGGHFFVSAMAGFEEMFSFQNLSGIASRYRMRSVTSELTAGIQFGKLGQIRAGLLSLRLRAEPTDGAGALLGLRIRDGGFFTQLRIDTFQNINFPTSGASAEAKYTKALDRYGSDWTYEKLEVGVMRAVSYSKNTLLTILRVGTGFGTDIPGHNDFDLGGFLNLSGYARGEISSSQGGVLALVFYRQIAGLPNSAIGNAVYVGGSLEMGSIWDGSGPFRFSDQAYGGGIFMGFDTILGPIYIGQGFGDAGRTVSYFYLGRTF
jgi:NTE family protein